MAQARSLGEMVALRDAYIGIVEEESAGLAANNAAGRIDIDTWRRRFAAQLSDHQATAFQFGIVGIEQEDNAA